jgi:hypothetical protein
VGGELLSQVVDHPGQPGVLDEEGVEVAVIVVGLCLLKSRLPVLSDHDEGRQEDRLQRDDERQRRLGTHLEREHPHGEQVYEAHEPAKAVMRAD